MSAHEFGRVRPTVAGAAAVLLAGRAAALPPLLVTNASRIYTLEPNDRGLATSLCVTGRDDSGAPGVVSGTSLFGEPLEGCPDDGETEVLDAMGAFVVPGFHDAHGHFISEGFRLNTPWLFDCLSAEEVVAALQAWVAEHPLAPGEWLQGQARNARTHTQPCLEVFGPIIELEIPSGRGTA